MKSTTNTGVTSKTIEANENELKITETQDVAPILDFNKHLQALDVNRKANMRHAASIPRVLWDQWMKDFKEAYGKNYYAASKELREKFIKLKLNDPENSFLRTWKGRI